MGIHTRSKSSLFLTEMILSILFFAIAAACCIQIFVKGHQISRHSENLNYAQNLASGMAETVMMAEGNADQILAIFPTAALGDQTVIVYYDRSWEACEPEDGSFVLKATYIKTSDTISGEAMVSGVSKAPETECIYQLPFRQHIAQSMPKER